MRRRKTPAPRRSRHGWFGARLGAALCLVVLAHATGCREEPEIEPRDPGDVVAEAARSYRPAAFDTVTWASDSVRVRQGNQVYASTCRRCHGHLGRGDTEVADARGLEVPSLVEPDWGYAASLDSVRKRIYTGHPEGMPTFGTFRLTPREIDGAAWYILEQLRPEVLDGAG